MELPSGERLIPFLLLYYTPVMIGAYRRTQAKAKSAPVWLLFLIIFLFGWTVIGWLYALRLAFLDWEMPWQNFRSGGGTFKPATGWTPPSAAPAAAEPARHRCASCGGSGSSYCTWCQGRGQWWDTVTNTAMHCQYCLSSGKLQCQSCTGSGWAQG